MLSRPLLLARLFIARRLLVARRLLPRLLLARPARPVVPPAAELLREVVDLEAGRVVVRIDVPLAVPQAAPVPAPIPQRLRRAQVPPPPPVLRPFRVGGGARGRLLPPRGGE